MARSRENKKSSPVLEKVPTGIDGLDEITGGGLPRGRPTLVCGSAGCGKTLFAMEFLVRGAVQFGEPGVYMSFEETSEELTKNVSSLGFDLNQLFASGKLFLDYVHIERSEIEETGEYDLEGLFVRLGDAIDSIGAKRVVLDTIESLFSGLPNPAILRAELRRLFIWLKARGMTTVITGESGVQTLTRQGLEEYVSDCVVFLDHRVVNQISTRRLRVIKYRGTTHGTNEYPFLISEKGIMVMPVTSLGLKHTAVEKRISSGIPRLDAMLGGKGYFRGTTVLVSGTAGTGKTSIASQFVDAACRRGERCLYFAFEESESQLLRNMRSIGIDFQPWVKKGFLRFYAERPTCYGLESHLSSMFQWIREFKPMVVVIDAISGLSNVALESDVKALLTRLIDHLKLDHVTTLLTNLIGGNALEQTDVGVSSLSDTWLMLREIEIGGERNRGINILKSRGMNHSNQIREFLLTDHGVQLSDVYSGPSGVLTGSARLIQEAQDREAEQQRRQEIQRLEARLKSRRKALQAQMAALQAQYQEEEEGLKRAIEQERLRLKDLYQQQKEMAVSRKAE